MFEIKGKINTAVCYAKVVEDEAIEQIRRMCDYEFTEGSKIRIMPDVHAGKGCTIGTTMTVTDKAVPNIVGVDIGCGMYTVNLGKDDIDFGKLDEAAHFVPSGMNVWEGRQERFDLTKLRCYRSLRDTKRLERSLGTLGGGNHFIEVDRAKDGTNYLVIHSGSRNLGKQVAEIYQQLAIDLNKGKETYFKERDDIIREYKAAGRRKEIQAALEAISWNKREATMPEDLCFLYGSYLEDYLADVEICQTFAKRNREKIAEVLLERTGMSGTDSFHTIHNYIDTEEMILRKGAIAAHEGEKAINSLSHIALPHLPEQEALKMIQIPTIDMVKTGQNIIQLRKEKGLSVKDIQDIFGFSTPQAIYKWQQGTALPSLDNLVILAMIFQVHVDDILVVNIAAPAQIGA